MNLRTFLFLFLILLLASCKEKEEKKHALPAPMEDLQSGETEEYLRKLVH